MGKATSNRKTMHLQLIIDTSNDAFGGHYAGELLRVVERMPVDVIHALEKSRPDSGLLRDSNGNTCGSWAVLPND